MSRRSLAREVVRLRVERDWSQADLVQRSGCSRDTIYRIETGAPQDVWPRTVGRIARALGVPEAQLLRHLHGEGEA